VATIEGLFVAPERLYVSRQWEHRTLFGKSKITSEWLWSLVKAAV
jgi:hypothetical protein